MSKIVVLFYLLIALFVGQPAFAGNQEYSNSTLDEVPNEMLALIADSLGPKELASVACSSKRLNETITELPVYLEYREHDLENRLEAIRRLFRTFFPNSLFVIDSDHLEKLISTHRNEIYSDMNRVIADLEEIFLSTETSLVRRNTILRRVGGTALFIGMAALTAATAPPLLAIHLTTCNFYLPLFGGMATFLPGTSALIQTEPFELELRMQRMREERIEPIRQLLLDFIHSFNQKYESDSVFSLVDPNGNRIQL